MIHCEYCQLFGIELPYFLDEGKVEFPSFGYEPSSRRHANLTLDDEGYSLVVSQVTDDNGSYTICLQTVVSACPMCGRSLDAPAVPAEGLLRE